jgi:hypothetical protein
MEGKSQFVIGKKKSYKEQFRAQKRAMASSSQTARHYSSMRFSPAPTG